MKISVIFTTYNSPEWLQKVLWGFDRQTDKNFEIVIADDVSDEETKNIITDFSSKTSRDVQLIWHEDKGFQECQILNKAIVAAKGEYIVMTDGDCIPHKDFISVHRSHAESGYFLSGGYFKLPIATSEKIRKADIDSGVCFESQWLKQSCVEEFLVSGIES